MRLLGFLVPAVLVGIAGCREHPAAFALPEASGWTPAVLPSLKMSVQLPPSTRVAEEEREGFFSHHASGKKAYWFAPTLTAPNLGVRDPIKSQLGYCTHGAKASARFLYQDENTLIVHLPDYRREREHCEVTACSTTKTRFCVEATSFSRDDDCAELAAMVRSLRDLP
jgi:hypothetical protein